MDHSTVRVFVSFVQDDPDNLKSMAFTSCARMGLDPYIFDWEMAKGISPEPFVERRMGECDLFLGIYEGSYGQRVATATGSQERVSAIEFELQTALRLLGKDNVRLFGRRVEQRDAALNRMLAHSKVEPISFETDLDFALLIDEAVKDWSRMKELRDPRRTPRTLSVKMTCRDRAGILAAVYRAIFIHGGNVVRSRQVSHLGVTDLTFIAQWQEGATYPAEDAVKETLLQELHTLLGDSTGHLEVVRVVAQEGEVKARGNFEVLFFDGPGIAERVFSVFARSSTSVVESSLVQVSSAPPIAKFLIAANATNITHERVSHLAQELRGQAGIVAVGAHLELGSWWY